MEDEPANLRTSEEARIHADANASASEDVSILFFTTMWGAPLDTRGIPDCCQLHTDRNRFDEADAVVFHIPTLTRLPEEKPEGQLWVAWSMECDAHYPRLRDPGFLRHFDLTMTYRLNSDVPALYTAYYDPPAEFQRRLRTPPRAKSPDRLASMFVSSGLNRSGRVDYATELMRYLDVHSFGKTLKNRRVPPPDRGRESKLDLIASYRFDLAFENAVGDDYVTEKFFDPLVVGTVPVYLGAPNVDRFAPGYRCFVDASAFDPKGLAEYLLHLQHDDAAYAEHFAWKDRPFRPGFLELLEEQATPPFARLCRLVQMRRAGRPDSSPSAG
jgi:hypothetical protein